MKQQNFFVFGLPRSRTAWFSNLLTTDDSICLHEYSPFNGYEKMQKIFKESGMKYCGESNPNPQFFFETKKHYPDSPFVYIRRPFKESLLSLIKLPIKEKPPNNAIEKVMISASSNIDKILSDKNLLIVDFHSITEGVCEQVIKHCMPDKEINMLRIRHLLYLNIQRNEKTIYDFKEYFLK